MKWKSLEREASARWQTSACHFEREEAASASDELSKKPPNLQDGCGSGILSLRDGRTRSRASACYNAFCRADDARVPPKQVRPKHHHVFCAYSSGRPLSGHRFGDRGGGLAPFIDLAGWPLDRTRGHQQGTRPVAFVKASRSTAAGTGLAI